MQAIINVWLLPPNESENKIIQHTNWVYNMITTLAWHNNDIIYHAKTSGRVYKK